MTIYRHSKRIDVPRPVAGVLLALAHGFRFYVESPPTWLQAWLERPDPFARRSVSRKLFRETWRTGLLRVESAGTFTVVLALKPGVRVVREAV